MLHYGVDLIAAQYVSKCRHVRNPRLIVAGKADAMGDRGADILWRAAPQPFIVVEVRIAWRSCRARAMALHAIDLESGGAGRDGELTQRVVGQYFFNRGLFDCRDVIALGRLGRSELGLKIGAAGPVEYARSGRRDQRPGWIGYGIDKRPENSGVERPQPPARHGVVEFLDAIPFMAGRGDATDLIDFLLAHLNRP